MKKKAIKIAAASAVAASAFVAAAPLQSNAASNVGTTVDNAVKQMQVAYHTYSDVTATGQFADIDAVYKALNSAKSAYTSAKAAVVKAGGAQKDAYLAKLDSNYKELITKRVVTYIDAYNYATKNLVANQEGLQKAIDAKNLVDVQKYYNEISYQLKVRTVILDRVYGQTTRELLRSSFKADAQDLRDTMQYDVTVAVKAKAVTDAVTAGKLDVAKAAVDQINTYLPKVSATFKTELTTTANAAVAAYEAKLTPAVESVSAINAKQLVVKFNKAVKADTLYNSVTSVITANITISRTTLDATTVAKNLANVAATKGSLSADGKTLTLTLPVANADYFDGTYVVTATEAVKDTDGKALTPFTGTFVVSDATAPVVTASNYSVTSGFKLTLSEPVTAVPSTIRVNGVDVQSTASLADDNKTIVIPKPASVAAGSTATIYVAGGVDYSGNQLAAFNGSAVVTNDTTAVQVTSLTQVASNKVRVVFNKPVATSDVNVKAATTLLRNGAAYADFTVAKNTTVDSTGKTFDITLGSSAAGPDFGNLYGTNVSSAGIVVAFADSQIADYYGNKLAASSQSITVTKDVAVPTVVSTTLSSDGKGIDVKFSQALSAKNAAKIEIRKDGTSVTNSVSAANIDGTDATILHITPGTGLVTTPGTDKLSAGTYSVRLQDGAVTNVNGVDVVGSTLSNVVVGSTTSDLTISSIVNNGVAPAGLNKFKVTFSEAVTAATALNAANYQLDGAALPAGTDIRFDGSAAAGTVVLIDLPANSVNIGSVATGSNAILSVAGVQTSSAKTVVSKYATVKIADNTPATLLSANLIGTNVLKLSFNENLTAGSIATIADILDDVVVKAGSTTFTAGDATATATISGKDVIITITPGTTDNWTAVSTASTVTVGTVAGDGDILDANGVTVKSAVSVTLVK